MNEDNAGDLKPMYDRLKLAATCDREQLFTLLRDSANEVLLTALRNPNLADDHLHALLKRTDLNEKVVETVGKLARVRESHPLTLAVVRNRQIPGPLLTQFLPHLFLFELVDHCTLAGATTDLKTASEREINRRLPTTPLGNKITLARRGTPAILKALLLDGAPQVVQATLDNPRLNEGALHQFLRTAKATEESISMIGRHPRWSQRPLLRQTILKHPRTPEIWYTLWLPRLNGAALRELSQSTRIQARQQQTVKKEMRRRGL